jgi:hypothetical protein
MFNSSNDSQKKLVMNEKTNSSLNTLSNKMLNSNRLDQSTASFKTKNSAENEYDE